jgi:hypothetical protein
MPAADVVLLPLCVGLALLGVIITGLAWRRGSRGRVVQGIGVALAPIALYFSGLLALLWNGVVALGGWASRILFTPAVWFGLSLLAVCLVLWVVGGMIARRSPARASVGGRGSTKAVAAGSSASAPAAAKGRAGKAGQPSQPAAPVDEDMAEIEAILKSRGIQ